MSFTSHILTRFLEHGHDHDDDHDHEDHAEEESSSKPWGSIIGAALLVQSATLIGLLVVAVASVYQKRGISLRKNKTLQALIPSFAAGALIATVVFLVVPESIALIGGGHAEESHSEEEEEDHSGHNHFLRRFLEDTEEEAHDEHKGGWKFGVFFILGFLFPVLIGSIFHTAEETMEELEEETALEKEASRPVVSDEVRTEDEIPETAKDEEKMIAKKPAETYPVPKVNKQLAASILVGDFLHNFADGIFVGTAFLLCDSSLAWTLMASTIYHELAQEIADFLLLTEFCNFSAVTALAANFCCGLSVLLGAILVTAIDFSDTVIGCILAASAGVYIYIAVAECVPKMGQKRLLGLVFFCLGAIPIGLVLLNHTHCEEGHAHDH